MKKFGIICNKENLSYWINIKSYPSFLVRICRLTKPQYIPRCWINSICLPCSTTFPFFITKIRSAFWIVLNRCAIVTVVLFKDARSNASCTTFSDSESSADVAVWKLDMSIKKIPIWNNAQNIPSSNNKIFGARIKARAMATLYKINRIWG